MLMLNCEQISRLIGNKLIKIDQTIEEYSNLSLELL